MRGGYARGRLGKLPITPGTSVIPVLSRRSIYFADVPPREVPPSHVDAICGRLLLKSGRASGWPCFESSGGVIPDLQERRTRQKIRPPLQPRACRGTPWPMFRTCRLAAQEPVRGVATVHTTPVGANSTCTSPPRSCARLRSISRVPNPRRVGASTGGPSRSSQRR
jgi:hypothetical protein